MLVFPVLALIVMTWLVSHARGVPDNDYWAIFGPIIRTMETAPGLADFYSKSNEHVVAAAKLFYLLNYYVTGGDNFGLSVIALLFSLGIALTLAISLVQPDDATFEKIAIGLIVSVFVFNPLAAHNFFLGMSGVAWIGANLFMVLAAAVFWRSAEKGRTYGLLLAVALAVVSSQFYSTGVSALLVLGIQGMFSQRTRRIGVALLVLGLAYVVWIWMAQEVPEGHAPRNFDPVALAGFCVTFIGSAIAGGPQSAFVWGIIGSLLAGIIVLRNLVFPQERDLKVAFWVALMAYACVAACMAAIARSNMGGDAAALASRYATIPSLFWIGILGLLSGELGKSPRARRALLMVFFGISVIMVSAGKARAIALMERGGGKGVATLALSLGVRDTPMMKHITPFPRQYYIYDKYLRRLHHVPFNGRDFGCPALGSSLDAPVDSTRVAGFIDRLSPTDGGAWVRAEGWAAVQPPGLLRIFRGLTGPGYGCVALLDADGMVVGLGVGGLHRKDVAKALGRARSDFGWIAYINTVVASRDDGPRPIHAAVNTSAGWVRLAKPIEFGQVQ